MSIMIDIYDCKKKLGRMWGGGGGGRKGKEEKGKMGGGMGREVGGGEGEGRKGKEILMFRSRRTF